ncbi:MAG: hypothetical protein MJB57_07615 [Gemmatimonadetes bacterium]|nr:hypothetical protein [Gemmatimonadota bacterium]
MIGRRSGGWTLVLVACSLCATALTAQTGDSVRIRLIDVDVRSAVQALAQYIDRPVVFGQIGEGRVTIETPSAIARQEILTLLEGTLETQSLLLIEEESHYRIEPVPAPEPPRPEPSGPPVEAGPLRLYVIQLRHARADDVAATVNALYGRASALGELGGPTTLSQQLRSNLVAEQDASPAAQPASRGATFEGDVTIIPDAGTNSLLVRASQADYELIEAAVQQVDVRPLQVLIEVVIAEVRRDKNLSIGLETILPGYRPFDEDDAEVSASNEGLGLGSFVLGIMRLGGVDLSATLRAAASRGDVTILSRPVVIAVNNESAEFLVGAERPFVQVQRSLPTDAPVRDQVVQFKEVGTHLTVTPTISQDGYVMLEVTQEVNAATAEVAFDAPVISTRSVQTQLLVRDGHTAVLGGLADRQIDITKSGIPVLSSLPLVGSLFGSRVERQTDTELFLFLTPTVIRTDDDLEEATQAMPTRLRSVGAELRRHGWLSMPEESEAAQDTTGVVVPDSATSAPPDSTNSAALDSDAS